MIDLLLSIGLGLVVVYVLYERRDLERLRARTDRARVELVNAVTEARVELVTIAAERLEEGRRELELRYVDALEALEEEYGELRTAAYLQSSSIEAALRELEEIARAPEGVPERLRRLRLENEAAVELENELGGEEPEGAT